MSLTYNSKAKLAQAYDVSPQTVSAWLRRGLPHRRLADGTYRFDRAEVAKWRAAALAEDSHRANGRDRRVIPAGAREWLDAMWVNADHLLPWLWDDPGHEPEDSAETDSLVVDAREYIKESGISGDEFLYRISFGLPLLPPAPSKPVEGGPLARISLPHSRAWLLAFSGFIESIGGDGSAKNIGHEGLRLRGFPVSEQDGEPEDGEGDDAGDGDRHS